MSQPPPPPPGYQPNPEPEHPQTPQYQQWPQAPAVPAVAADPAVPRAAASAVPAADSVVGDGREAAVDRRRDRRLSRPERDRLLATRRRRGDECRGVGLGERDPDHRDLAPDRPDDDPDHRGDHRGDDATDDAGDDHSPATASTTTQAPPPEPEVSTGQRNALRSASDHLDFTSFPRTGLIAQLEYEGYSTADATWAVDNVSVDWNEQAAKKAAEYLEFTSFSRQGLVDQLLYEGFSPAEAEYGVSQAYD